MPVRTVHFTVEGTGDFPVDMLRYDRCWPVDEGGSESGYNILTPDALSDRCTPRRVRLATIGSPRRARWQSFGWRIV